MQDAAGAVPEFVPGVKTLDTGVSKVSAGLVTKNTRGKNVRRRPGPYKVFPARRLERAAGQQGGHNIGHRRVQCCCHHFGQRTRRMRPGGGPAQPGSSVGEERAASLVALMRAHVVIQSSDVLPMVFVTPQSMRLARAVMGSLQNRRWPGKHATRRRPVDRPAGRLGDPHPYPVVNPP